MSKISDPYLKGVPQKPYDLLREGAIVLIFVTVVVIILAAVFSSPDYPTLRGEDVAKLQPITYLKTSIGILAGMSSLQDYGPPFNDHPDDAQQIFGIAPANVLGVTIPIDPPEDFILKPLERVAVLNQDVAEALITYRSASAAQKQTWTKNYLDALDRAAVSEDEVQIPEGDYGPVDVMMMGMLDLGKAGLLEGALESNERLPYTLNFTRSLLFFQDDVYADIANHLDMLGDQWGISHETGPYPGGWWVWPYTFFYQIPPMRTSPNGDIQVISIMTLVLLFLLLIPFIPLVNRIPHWLGVYKIIWRDWYARERRMKQEPGPGGSKPVA
jgi:hypothetical protein